MRDLSWETETGRTYQMCLPVYCKPQVPALSYSGRSRLHTLFMIVFSVRSCPGIRKNKGFFRCGMAVFWHFFIFRQTALQEVGFVESHTQ